MQDQKIKFWFADRKKVSKTRISNRAARKGQFHQPYQLNLYHKVIFHLIAKLPIFWNMLPITRHSVKPSYTPIYKLCHLPLKAGAAFCDALPFH